ncbi:DUF2254 family protein [Saccharothrix hoggarensis]|uniref:DUF2254 family protein n=1 Tax=Saccharothrix hoggarensis TaxID=913853 RepID=A0ABW3QI89_9PSEU
MWLWPGIGGVAGFACALLSVPVRLGQPHPLGWLGRPGGLNSATAFLQSLATSVITVTGLTFRLIIVALQLASQQFSPRLLREFMRDRVIKAVLAVLVSAFVFAITALRHVGHEESVPDLTLLIVFGASIAVLIAILAFITHIPCATGGYVYYGDTETRDNPCTPEVESINQGGLAKVTRLPTPASGAAREDEQVFDASGRVVAKGTSGSWTCTTYDGRDRVISVKSPSTSSAPERTVTTNYAVNGDPLITAVSDPNGTVTTRVDLLGRVV